MAMALGNGFFPSMSITLRQPEIKVGGKAPVPHLPSKPAVAAAVLAMGLCSRKRRHGRSEAKVVSLRAFYEVTPREGCAFGASVRGFSVKEALEKPEVLEQIRSDMYKHRLLIFHGQTDLTPEDHIKLSEHLGSLEHILHRPHPKSPDPRLLRVANDDREGFMSVGTSGWHVDGVMLQAPFAAQTMHHLHAIPGVVAKLFRSRIKMC